MTNLAFWGAQLPHNMYENQGIILKDDSETGVGVEYDVITELNSSSLTQIERSPFSPIGRIGAPNESYFFDASTGYKEILGRSAIYLESQNDSGIVDQIELDQHIFIWEADFRWKLLSAFQDEPIENGFNHPAERVIQQALRSNQSNAVSWIQAIYHENQNRASVAAAILRCVGRLSRGMVRPWGDFMIITGLSHSDVEVREAAVRAIEMWVDPSLSQVLQDHDEQVPWLRDYINQVIGDLEE